MDLVNIDPMSRTTYTIIIVHAQITPSIIGNKFSLMSTLFEASLSTSAMRAPLGPVHAPSIAESLPSINFGFDELRERMAAFTERFDTFIAAGRQRVLVERNEHRKRLAELEGMFLHGDLPMNYACNFVFEVL